MSYWATPDDAARTYSRLAALPAAQPEDPGFFSGLGGAVSDIPGALVERSAFGLTSAFAPGSEPGGAPAPSPDLSDVDASGGIDSTPDISDWLAKESSIRRDAALASVPNPQQTGAAGQILFGLGTQLPEMIAAGTLGTMATGNPAAGLASAAAYETWIEGNFQRAQLEKSGVDPETATALGFGRGALSGATAFLPLGLGMRAGATLLTNAPRAILAQAAANTTIGVGERAASAAYLQSRGYDDMANQIHPFSAAQVATDAILGGVFGLWALKHAPPVESTPIPGYADERAPGTVAPIPPPDGGRADAAMTLNSAGHAQLDLAPGTAVDVGATNQHVDALVQATEQMLNEQPVDVSQTLAGAHFEPLAPDILAARDQLASEAQDAASGVANDELAQQQDALGTVPGEPELTYTPAEGLSPGERAVETSFGASLRDFDAARERYNALPDSEGGHVISADVARELSPDYLADRTLSTAVHEPASAFVKRLYSTMLREPTPAGKEPLVMFTAGGTGAGKTSSIAGSAEGAAIKASSQMVYDTNMNNLDSADAKIQAALSAGKKVHVMYVYREPKDALLEGALPRAIRQEARFGSGRTVRLRDHLATSRGSKMVLGREAAKYRDDPRVEFEALDNSFGKGKQQSVSLDQVAEKDDNTSVEQLRAAFDERYEQEPFSDAIYRGFTGEAPREVPRPQLAVVRGNKAGPEGPGPGSGGEADNGGRPGQPARDQVAPGASPGALPSSSVLGRSGDIRIGNRSQPATWALVDATDVAPTLTKGENQARDRTRAASQQQISSIASNLDFRLLGDSPVMDFGAPTLAADGRVVGGNGRVAAVNQAYEGGTADAYRQALTAALPSFGIDAEAATGLQRPMLVRVLGGDTDVRGAALASNEGGGMRMSMLEQSAIDAERLPPLAGFHVPESGELNAPANRDFVRDWVGRFPGNEQAALVDAHGALSQEGTLRLRNAVLHSAYGDSPTLQRLVESTDQGARNVSTALIRAAPVVATDRAAIASGDLHPLDLTPHLLDAVDRFNALKAEGARTRAYLAQGELMGPSMSPEGRTLLRFIDDHARSAKAISDLVSSYYRRLEAAGNPKEGDLFGGASADASALLDRALGDVDGPEVTSLSLLDPNTLDRRSVYPGLAVAPRSEAGATYDAASRAEDADGALERMKAAAACGGAA